MNWQKYNLHTDWCNGNHSACENKWLDQNLFNRYHSIAFHWWMNYNITEVEKLIHKEKHEEHLKNIYLER
jgi:hypothetical protein